VGCGHVGGAVSEEGWRAHDGVEPSTPRHLKKFYIFVKKRKAMKMTNPFAGSNNVDGLYVKDGRLINEREDGETGIAQAARYRAQMKKQYKIESSIRLIVLRMELSELRCVWTTIKIYTSSKIFLFVCL